MATTNSSSTHKGWKNDPDNSRLAAQYDGTDRVRIDSTGASVNGTLTSSGAVSIDDTTEASSATTGSLHTDGGLGVAKNAFFGSTIENADGVGTDGEQLTSGGAAATTDWAAAASLREFKHLEAEREDAAEVLDLLVNTPVYDFKYRSKDEALPGERIMGTGDNETTYTGIVADEAPWAMHYHGKILNPINALGYTLLAIKALEARIAELEG